MRTSIVVAASAAVLWAGAPVHAQEPGAAQEQREHEVREGDTLWDLAQLYYENPWLWQRIFEANTNVVEDPHWIYPSERLVIPGLAQDFPREPAPQVETVTRPRRTMFYTAPPAQAEETRPEPTILSEESRVTMSVRPGEYYAAPWLSDLSDMPVLGRMVQAERTEDISWRATETARVFDDIHLSYNLEQRPAVGERLMLVNLGRRVGDWGRIVEPVAFGEVRALEPEVLVVRLLEQLGPVQGGALAVRFDSFPEPLLPEAEPVEDGAEGHIITFETERNLYPVESRAFIDLGAADGINIGDELLVFQPERPGWRGVSERLPEEAIASLRVVHVRERMATARVFHVTAPALEPGLPVRVVKKMP